MQKRKVLYIAPRILALLFVVFISLFALDVFSIEGTILEKIGGFLIHLIPSAILITAILIAWKKERLGGILFIALFILATFISGNWIENVLIFSPLFIIGVLFMLSSFLESESVP